MTFETAVLLENVQEQDVYVFKMLFIIIVIKQ